MLITQITDLFYLIMDFKFLYWREIAINIIVLPFSIMFLRMCVEARRMPRKRSLQVFEDFKTKFVLLFGARWLGLWLIYAYHSYSFHVWMMGMSVFIFLFFGRRL